MTDQEIVKAVSKAMFVAARSMVHYAILDHKGIVAGYDKRDRELFRVKVKHLVGAIPKRQQWKVETETDITFAEHNLTLEEITHG